MKYIFLVTALLSYGAFSSDFDEMIVLAKQKPVIAQYNIGAMYSRGICIPKNDAKAMTWYRKAANHLEIDVVIDPAKTRDLIIKPFYSRFIAELAKMQGQLTEVMQ